jgi:hypothetical protein
MPDMNCAEIHCYFEDYLRDENAQSDGAAVTEHIAACADCGRFVEERRELGKNLRMIRESAGPVPAVVDSAVVSGYRQFMADQSAKRRNTFSVRSAAVMQWSSVAAAVLIAASVLFYLAHRITTTSARPGIATPIKRVAVAETVAKPAAIPVKRSAKHKRAAIGRMRPSISGESPVISRAQFTKALSAGFRSLMYCDELSCSGDMDMIRVQLPSSAMPRQASSFMQPVRSVTADVLVGSDGIARGIRLEEVEF